MGELGRRPQDGLTRPPREQQPDTRQEAPRGLLSRYCTSDILALTTEDLTAEDLVADTPRTGALLETVRSWVEASSDRHVDAGLGVPARLASAYTLDLERQDLHAVVEAHDGPAWRPTLDPTGPAAVGTLARTVTGGGAADVAWGTTEGTSTLEHLEVAVARG